MSNSTNHNSKPVTALSGHQNPTDAILSAAIETQTPAVQNVIRHIYVHIPFCACVCPYCAFYKELVDSSRTNRFCEAILRELEQLVGTSRCGLPSSQRSDPAILPLTIYFGGGTPTTLSIAQLELLLRGFHERLDLSQAVEYIIEANPGSVSRRKADVLKKLGINRISLGVQSWDDALLKLLGREHNARQAEESFGILRAAGFTNINVDLMFGLPGQTADQWRSTLEKTIALQSEHISTYCLTYEEDTEFFLRHGRGEFHADSDCEAELFEITMSILQAAGYEHYEISNYARPGFESLHNRAYWTGQDYIGVGPSAFSTVGFQRRQNVPDYRKYIERILSGRSAIGSMEILTDEMKRAERIAISLRTREGVLPDLLWARANETNEFLILGLLQRLNGRLVLTPKGKSLADSVAEALL